MANTVIQLKQSTVTDIPPQLNIGEPAYSYTSNTLFIGTADGLSTVNIGGLFYTTQLDEATDANTASKLVKRDADGSFSATAVRASLFGNANTATALQTARNFSIDGADVDSSTVSFDGTGAVVLQGNLKTTGVSSGNYGGATNIPTFAVDSKGRITSAANVSISTTLTVAGDTGQNTVSLADDTLTFVGGDGITTSIDPTDNVKIDVDNTVVRTSGSQSIVGDLAITGNLIVTGSEVIQDVSTVRTEDALLHLAANNAADTLDIGFFGQYENSGTKYTAFYRDSSDSGKFKILVDGSEEPSAANTVNAAAFGRGTLDANFTGGTVSGLSAAIDVADGGTGATTFTTGGIVIGNGTSGLQILANTSSSGSYGNASHTVAFTVDAYGRVSAAANTPIALDTAAITSGTLPINRGGTNQTSFTTGNFIVFDGTSITSLANTASAGTYANASHVPVITTDDLGRVVSVANTPIAIDASAVTSGTLGVARGGTGATTFTTNGILLGQGTSAVTTVSSSTEGHVLQINASGAPTFAQLNGGSF
jgi:hypothetical protein